MITDNFLIDVSIDENVVGGSKLNLTFVDSTEVNSQ